MEVKRLFIYCVVILVLAVPVISLAITGDPFTSSGTQESMYKVEWSNEIILPYEYAGQPNISADGKKIVFLKYKGQDDYYNEIWTANSDGTEAKAILLQRRTEYKKPIWSPDGTKIVYIKKDYEMWTVNADGTWNTPIADKSYEKKTPAWWPDGSKIIYYQGAPLNETVPFEQFGLYILDFATNSVKLFGEPGWGGPIAFSPDAQTLVIREGQDLLFLNPDGTLKEKKTITAPLKLGEEPIWSSNGKYIIIGNILYVIATGEEIPFLPNDIVTYKEEGKPDLVRLRSMTFSKDGKRIAFMMDEMIEPGTVSYRGKIKILDLTWK